jgi:rod shape-determining protein MreC
MSSRTWILPLWISAAALLGLPEETNQSAQKAAAGAVAMTLKSPPPQSPHEENPMEAWAQERDDDYQDALLDASSFDEKFPFYVANVIYQANTPWSSTVWIDVGSQSEHIPFAIERNCPVVFQDTLVGVVDYVGAKASRVRLICDPSVKPAVRVVRGGARSRHLMAAAQKIRGAVATQPALLPKPELSTTLTKLLDCLIQSLPADAEMRLAKGELQGAEYPSSPSVLRGVGFNYDFEDEEGPARDLRNGQRSIQDQKILLIKPGDELETSGLDGIFPRGLRVAMVETVFPLEEGAISYRILAKIESSEFPNFEYLSVLPTQPQGPLQPPTQAEFIAQLISPTLQAAKE